MQELSPQLKNRFQSLDFMRGIALCGILLMNVPGFAFPLFNIEQVTNFTGINYKSWWIVEVFFSGTMRGLFSILFGASCMLILSKTNDNDSTDIYFRRLLWMVLFGLFNAYILMWFGDILYGYATIGVFLFPFRKVSGKWLVIIGVIISLSIFARSTYKYTTERKPTYMAYKTAMTDSTKLHKKLTIKQKEDVAKFTKMAAFLKKDTAAINKDLKAMKGNFKSVFDKRWVDGEMYQRIAVYDFDFLDVLLMMLIGMGLFKLGALTNKLGNKEYALMALMGYALGLFLRIRYVNSMYFDQKGMENFFETYTIPTGAFRDFQRLCVTIGHIGFLMLIFRSGVINWFVKALSNVGQMALSNYLLQSTLSAIYFYGFGFNKYGELQIYQTYIYCAVIWVICIIFSALWLRFFQLGPFEWVWRSLTYWKMQPMKKE